MMQTPLEEKEEKEAPKEEILDKAKDNTEKSIKIDQLIQKRKFKGNSKSTIYGIPYKKSLDNIELILDLKAPEILRNLAETGIPTMKDLSGNFSKVCSYGFIS